MEYIIKLDYATYEHIKRIADKLQWDMDLVLYNAISDNILEEYYETEIKEANEAEFWEELRQERKLER